VVFATWRSVPRIQTTTKLAYSALMASLWALWKKYPALRRAAFAQGLLSIGFSAFWSTLALLLHAEPFHLGSAAAGTFGLAGAASALAAPLVGRMADRTGPAIITRIGTGMAAFSFGLMLMLPWLSPHAQLILLGVSVLGFDLGVQVTLIAHQTIIYSIEPGARSRLNAVLFVGMFLGMAIGAGLGGIFFDHWGWMAVTVLTFVASATAFLLRLLPIAQARE
jgi:MFS family permease